MASIDLNIIDRGINSSRWTNAGKQITANDLTKVEEQSTDNGNALNALPTPFARFFIFNEAFRRVLEGKRDDKKQPGIAYQRLVSDCLDVFEILFNLNYHRNHWNGKCDILIKEWSLENDLERLKENQNVLYKSLKSYYKNDINLDKLYFIVFQENGKEKLIGISSPHTGFITPPDLDKDDNGDFVGERYQEMKIQRVNSPKSYFKDIVLFEERSAEFKNYLFQLMDKTKEFDMIREYVKAFADDKDIHSDANISCAKIETEDKNQIKIKDLEICSFTGKSTVKIFADSIIKLPYNISTTNFNCGKNEELRYLLPLSSEALRNLDIENLDFNIKEKSSGLVEVTIGTDKREYSPNNNADKGKIIDLESIYESNFELGIFPNLKSENTQENDYYKVMLISRDGNEKDRFDIHKSTCTFYRKTENGCEGISEGKGLSYGVLPPVVRSVQSDECPCSTKFYEIYKTDFCAIELKLNIEGENHTGVLLPKFKTKKQGNKNYTYAVDFGTSNTFVSKCENGNNNQPIQLTMPETMMSMLHKEGDNKQKYPIDICEEMPSFENALDFFRYEFVPPFIDGEKYKFPLRTALCQTEIAEAEPRLFDTANIAFGYGKFKSKANHPVKTNIKWENLEDAELYIQELLLLIKCDALMNGIASNQLSLIWFYPLSFNKQTQDEFARIWKENAEKILQISENQIKSYTESEAPFFFYSKLGVFKSEESVATIDIGGGSSDMVLFEDGELKIANSVHFGCDVLWGDGFREIVNTKRNGFYQHFKDQISFEDDELKAINESMLETGSETSSIDVLNFWISNEAKIKISGSSNRFTTQLKAYGLPAFVYHYTALMFHFAQTIKANGCRCPRAIAFCGNGSKYIDHFISSDKEVLTDVTMMILKEVFGTDIKTIQIILPKERKEATCYGGLYHSGNCNKPKPIVYHDFEGCDTSDVEELTKLFNSRTLSDEIQKSVERMTGIYREVIRYVAKEEGIDIPKDLCDNLNEGIADTLRDQFRKRVLPSKGGDYKDSIFFLPIIQKVYELTKTPKTED